MTARLRQRAARAAIVATLVATGLCASVGPALAHHAWNEVDTSTTFALTGRVKSLKWENPHASLVLTVADGGSTVDWTVMMSGLARMEQRGVTASDVAVGRTVTIVASPARGEPHLVRANRVQADGKDHVLY